MTAPVVNGRGAWSRVGKDNGSVTYRYIKGKPADGSTPAKSAAHEAVNYGVKAIQSCLNKEGYKPALVVDGSFGPKSEAAVKWFQTEHGLKADGIAGAITCRRLWHKPLLAATASVPVDPKWIYGQMVHESSGDPGACGYFHAPDRGLNQINIEAHPEISMAQAHDPYFSMKYATDRFRTSMNKFAGKGPDLQVNCAILSHNSPVSATLMYDTGEPPTPTTADYITSVRTAALGWVG